MSPASRITVRAGPPIQGTASVPGDKSIAHRWLLLAATARGVSELGGLPNALDVRSTARVLSFLAPARARDALERWASGSVPTAEGDGSTTNKGEPRHGSLRLEGAGRAGLEAPIDPVDCGNSGTTMRLLAGIVAASPFSSVLTGDQSLVSRPMERVAAPLREMGAEVATTDGHAPVRIGGSPLRGIRHAPGVPSAQVKGAVLFAALAAEGETTVVETAPTRDHTERALAHLGAPIQLEGAAVSLRRFQHEGFAGTVPGDVSSAAFLIAAAAVTGGGLRIERVGLNPSRIHFLEVLARMGVRTGVEVEGEELGEPIGSLTVDPVSTLRGTTVSGEELPLVIDEVPILALLAAHARGDTWFLGAGELRVKESDRLGGLSDVIRSLGGHAGVEHDDLVIAGGGLTGGTASSGGDHRMAMAAFVGGLGAAGTVTIEGMEDADVSFPGFVDLLRDLGASAEQA